MRSRAFGRDKVKAEVEIRMSNSSNAGFKLCEEC